MDHQEHYARRSNFFVFLLSFLYLFHGHGVLLHLALERRLRSLLRLLKFLYLTSERVSGWHGVLTGYRDTTSLFGEMVGEP